MSSRSGAEVRDALFNGRPVSWGFNPKEKRVVLTFPKVLGGETYILCIAGYYTFVARPRELGVIPSLFSTGLFRRGACAIKQVFSRSTA
jgi:hypothetical protein